MNWSAEMASHDMWSGLDTTKTNSEVRAYFKRCLQDAFDAGGQKGQSVGGADTDVKASTWLPSPV